MEVAIGLLAHNEERRIEGTLKSLFGQSIFASETRASLGIDRLSVVCVPNGCTDQTVGIIRKFSDGLIPDAGLSFECHELAEAGKSRAWNFFVHEASLRTVHYLVLIDADIEFGSPDVLQKLIAHIEANTRLAVVTDRPIKSTKRKFSRSVKDKLSLAASNQVETEGKLSGQVYCGRAEVLRQIWMPLALPVEDGFLAAMIETDGFTRSGQSGLIAQAPNAFHFFQTHETLIEFLRHESRIVVGSTINAWLFALLWKEGSSGHVGEFIRKENERDQKWLDKLVKTRASESWWLVPSSFIFKRVLNLKGRPWPTQLLMLPVALGASLLQALVCLRANSLLRQEGSVRLW